MNNPDWYAQALAALKARQLDVAEQYLRRLLQSEPVHAQGLLVLGRVLRERGRPAEAVELYQRLLQSQPEHADGLCQLAGALKELGRREEALQIYRQLLRIFPRHGEGLMALGTLLAESGQLDEALRCLREAVEVQPDSAQARHNLGVGLGVVGRLPEARAQLEEALRLQPQYPEAHYNLGNILNRMGLLEEAIASLRQAIALRPDYGEALTNLGLVLQRSEQSEEAAAVLRQVTRLQPRSGEAFSNLGLTLHQAGRSGEALVLLRHAVRLNPTYAPAVSNLAKVSFDLGRFAEAEQYLEQALRLQPQNAEMHANLGSLLQACGRWDEAMGCLDLALELDPRNVSAHYHRGITLLQTGNWRQGWAEFEYRFPMDRRSERAFLEPRWDGSAPAGRTILLWVEQGVGDMIHFIRYVPLLKAQGATLILECPLRLAPLFRCCAGVERIVSEGDIRPDFDVQAPLGSLPGLLGTTPQTIPSTTPYVRTEPARVERWRQVLGAPAALRVGIAWQGNPKHGQDRWRSAPLEQFAPLAAVPNVELISLQQGPGSEQIEALQGRFGVRRLTDGDLDSPDAAFLDTAALIQCLDLVVTVDTSLGHLAGALAAPVWLALSTQPDWRWGRQGERTAWYPSMRLFRQRELGQWGPVFEQIACELQRLAQRPRNFGPGKE